MPSQLLSAFSTDDVSLFQTLDLKEFAANWPLIHAAAEFDALRICQFLLEQRGESLAREQWAVKPGGDKPLHVACSCASVQVVELLIGSGASVIAKNSIGEMPLHLAVARYEIRCATKDRRKGVDAAMLVTNRLLDAGVDLDARDNLGLTALHGAVAAADEDISYRAIVERLLESGANPNAQDDDGSTPLHVLAEDASDWIRFELYELLAQYGARLEVVDSQGMTPLDLVRRGAGDNEAVKVVSLFGN